MTSFFKASTKPCDKHEHSRCFFARQPPSLPSSRQQPSHNNDSTIGPLVSDEAAAEARRLWDHGTGSMKYPAAQRSQSVKTSAVATHSFAARTQEPQPDR
jgi:hypothetical protein